MKAILTFDLPNLASGLLVAALFLSRLATAQTTHTWNATNGVSATTNWSDNLNWNPNGTPGGPATVVFSITNSVPAATGASNIVNNVVNSSATIGNLLYTNSYVAGATPTKIANWNVTLIPRGGNLDCRQSDGGSLQQSNYLGGRGRFPGRFFIWVNSQTNVQDCGALPITTFV